MEHLVISIFVIPFVLLSNTEGVNHVQETCDIIIAGGSTAALAAAIGAAREDRSLQVCLTEPTDWLGGQLTSSAVSAIDFGPHNRDDKYLAKDFKDMMDSLGPANPGSCWVSLKCYTPLNLLNGWINHTVNSYSNLKVFYNTVIKKVSKLNDPRKISSVLAVQRQMRSGVDQWRHRLSESLEDWYSTSDSNNFLKTTIIFHGKQSSSLVVIDATEYGDVLVLSGASFHQGVETPSEDSSSTIDTCGQATVFPFYIQMNSHTVPTEPFPRTRGSYSLGGTAWGKVWSYRRSAHKSGPYHTASPGDISNQNWGDGNDYKDSYLFLSQSETLAQRQDWKGGVNVNTLKKAEDRAYGWYWFYRNQAPSDVGSKLSLALESVVGTRTGLSKVPYIRDTRRSIGINNFTLKKSDFSAELPGQYGTKYADRIGLGDYQYADVHGIHRCSFPHYVNVFKIKPFYIPYRALTNKDVDNLLVAGKTMAQSFQANAASRMHPEEWNSGIAAGIAAVMMASDHITSHQLYQRVSQLQQKVRVHSPIDWEI